MEASRAPDSADDGSAAVAGFWRRVLACVIDGTILGAPAFLLGLVFFDLFASFGSWGRAIGFAVTMLYLGLLNSSLGGGRTIGKRAAAIRVVGPTGQPVGLARSFLRGAILTGPYFLNGAVHDPALLFSWVGVLVGLAIFGFGLSNIYLLVFNRRNRRGLHDLLAGTRVVRSSEEVTGSAATTWAFHYVIVALILIASVAAPLLFRSLANSEFFRGLLQLQSAIIAQPGVNSASVLAGSNVFWQPGGSRTTTFCNVVVSTRRRLSDPEAFGDEIARIVLDRYPDARRVDAIVINLVYGYDLGIASASTSQTLRYTPAEWEQRIQNRSDSL